MGVEALIATLERETEARVAEIRAAAAARIAELSAEAPDAALPSPPQDPLADVHLASRRTVLDARARLLDRVLAAAREALPDGPVDLDAARTFVDGPTVLLDDGRLAAEDGSVTVDCTWAARLDAAFPGLKSGVLDRLGKPP